MSEIKRDLFKIPPEIEYFNGKVVVKADSETFVINESHTLSDVVRWLLTQGDAEDIIYLINENKTD